MFTTVCSVQENQNIANLLDPEVKKREWHCSLSTTPQLFTTCMALSTSIRWINLYPVDNAITSQILIRPIVIFPLGSAIQLLNNQDQINHYPVDKYQEKKLINCILLWIKIYPVDSTIGLLNNCLLKDSSINTRSITRSIIIVVACVAGAKRVGGGGGRGYIFYFR